MRARSNFPEQRWPVQRMSIRSDDHQALTTDLID